MKVLMITGAYYPEISSGGLQSRLMAGAMRGQAQVRVLTTAIDRTAPRHARVDDVDVTRIRVRPQAPGSIGSLSVMLPALFRLIRWSDVVHIHGVSSKNILAAGIARLCSRPIVLSLHTAREDEPAVVRRRGWASWWAFRSAARYLTVSPSLTAAYLAAGLPANRVEQVGNGIDTALFAPAPAEEKRRLRITRDLDPDRPLVLFVGFFSHDKQPRVLFDAWLRMREKYGIDATLVFVGATQSDYHEVDARLAGQMRADAEARGVGDRVVFAGQRHEIHEYFRLADVFVLPSRREGLPVALLEAMSCALPSVASLLPGSTDTLIANGVSGLLVEPGYLEAFADGMHALLSDRARAGRMGEAARATVLQRYAAASVAARWIANYQLALGASGVNRT